jgi:DNA invertase Pin-like site-specific DNA recombinase
MSNPFFTLLSQTLVLFYGVPIKFISMRTKQGLAAAKAQGKQLDRPLGSKNRARPLDPHYQQIQELSERGLSIA